MQMQQCYMCSDTCAAIHVLCRLKPRNTCPEHSKHFGHVYMQCSLWCCRSCNSSGEHMKLRQRKALLAYDKVCQQPAHVGAEQCVSTLHGIHLQQQNVFKLAVGIWWHGCNTLLAISLLFICFCATAAMSPRGCAAAHQGLNKTSALLSKSRRNSMHKSFVCAGFR